MTTEKLYNFQISHVQNLAECVLTEQCVLDASSTGTGKTYCALKVCEHVGLKPFIICPKAVITNWITVSKYLNVPLLGVANYEKAKIGKYYNEKLQIIESKFIKESDEPVSTHDINKHKFILKFPENTIIIFDEAHRCKNWKTSNFGLMLSVKDANLKMMLLSATISDKIECFRTFGFIFNLFHHTKKAYKTWLCTTSRNLGLSMTEDTKKLYEPFLIHTTLFPRLGSRMDIKDVAKDMPPNNIIANCYFTDNTDKINEQYDEINDAMKALHEQELQSNPLVRILRARQKIELYKIPIIIDLAKEAIDGNFSVVIFVNFRQTMDYLSKELDCQATIHGKQTLTERQDYIDAFQKNKIKMIIANISAGGVGISLHDLVGGHPRMSIISPTWSGQDLVQCLGRIHRLGAKSNAVQKIIYCANTYEETVCERMTDKIKLIDTINDGDLIGIPIPKEVIHMSSNEDGEIHDDVHT